MSHRGSGRLGPRRDAMDATVVLAVRVGAVVPHGLLHGLGLRGLGVFGGADRSAALCRPRLPHQALRPPHAALGALPPSLGPDGNGTERHRPNRHHVAAFAFLWRNVSNTQRQQQRPEVLRPAAMATVREPEPEQQGNLILETRLFCVLQWTLKWSSGDAIILKQN